MVLVESNYFQGLSSLPAQLTKRFLSLITWLIAALVAAPALSAASTITIYPTSAAVRVNANQQFSAAINGKSNSTAIWSVNGVVGGNSNVGLVSGTGLFTGPVALTSPTVTVRATDPADSSSFVEAVVTVLNPAPGLVNITPTTINTGKFSLTLNGKNFVNGATATLGGVPLSTTFLSSTQLAVTGSTNAAPGTVLPLTVTNPNPGAASSTINYTIQPAIYVTLSPSSFTLYPGATQTLNAAVFNTSNKAITWLVNGVEGGTAATGTIVATSSTAAVYTAPAVPPTQNVVQIQAKSLQDPSALSPASLGTLMSTSISISPATPSVRLGSTAQFSASAKGLSNSSVTWSVNGAAGGNATFGTITSGGLYTAPPTMPASAVVVTATSTVSKGTTGSMGVNLLNPTPALVNITPSTINSGPFSIQVNGRNFVPGVTVTLGGKALNTTFVSSTTLSVTGSTDAAPGAVLPLTVTNPNPGSASSTINYTIQAGITLTLTPGTGTVRAGAAQSFTAAVFNTSNKAVNWSVNGVSGGNSTVGSIVATSGTTATYTAPLNPPAGNSVSIQAISQQDPNAASPASVLTISNPVPVLQTISPTTIHFGPIKITVSGTGFVPGCTVMLGSTALQTQYVSSTQVVGTGTAVPVLGAMAAVTVANPNPGAATSNAAAVIINEAKPVVSYQSAFHFLEQASWGPTPYDTDLVQQIGFDSWMNAQKTAPISPYTLNPPDLGQPRSDFFTNALFGPDQLRQRMAFALWKIFSISALKDSQPAQIIPFQQLLLNGAFGNFYDLLKTITLHPSMGRFLDMVNNDKATGTNLANENYAREVMQLFTIGTVKLNLDGSVVRDSSGNPVPTYDQTTIQNFARVFTGWTYPATPGVAPQAHNQPYYGGPMVAWEANHDTGSKVLLNGYQVPGGLSAADDLDQGLQNIFNHPNVGPFISFKLIQSFTTSNPSPAYIQRVAQVFNDNGQGVRGDLWAVVRAILLDPEARASDNVSTRSATGGRLKDPILLITHLVRELSATQVQGNNNFAITANTMGQNLFYPPSVFGYYPPTNPLPGNASLYGPEYQILNTSTALARINWIYQAVTNAPGPGVKIDLTPLLQFAYDPPTLVKALSNALHAGQLPQNSQDAIVAAITGMSDPLTRVQSAAYLAAASNMFQVQH